MKTEKRSRFDAMTLNERLFELHLLDAFAAAIDENNLVELRKMLNKAHVTGQEANEIASKVLSNRKKYGL